MGFLPDFTLSSNPEITVRLREATVEDAIDFSELDPAFEEEATTVFLDRMQAPEKYTDPRCTTRCQWLTSARHVKKSILFP